MSRPYLQINPTYNSSTDVVNLNITALRLRGVSSLTFTGMSASQTINITNGQYFGSYTFSAQLDSNTFSQTGSTVYTSATCSITFGGTFSGNSTCILPQLQIGGSAYPIVTTTGFTFSATQSLSTGLNNLCGSFSTYFAASWPGFSATVSGNSIVVSAPWGAYYNSGQFGLKMAYPAPGTSYRNGSLTFSSTYPETASGFVSGSFSGGTSQYLMDLNLNGTGFGDISDPIYLIVS